MKNLKNILVGIDYSPASDNALREAARIAAWDDANLHATTVFTQSARGETELHLAIAVQIVDRRRSSFAQSRGNRTCFASTNS